jgi:hypothetical protein
LPSETPYLSVVVTTRNDDHGGDPLKRLQAFINTFHQQTRRTGLSAELIVVEWNPPSDRPRIHQLVNVPKGCGFRIRFIEVPSVLHDAIPFGNVLPLFQMIGKNVGIRRASGRFVLSTNIDIIFSNELVEYLASEQLAPGFHYRIDRHDIEPDFPVTGQLDEQIAYCQTHQLRLHTRSGTHTVARDGTITTLRPDIAEPPVITLGRGWHVREGNASAAVYRWVMKEATLFVDRSTMPEFARQAALAIDIEPNPYQPESSVEIEVLEGERRLTAWRLSRRLTLWIPLPDDVVRNEITLRMNASSGGRDSLPLFERREHLYYRVNHMRVTREARHEYKSERWRPATNSPHLSVDSTANGVSVVTDPGRYSYAARYGPFQSDRAATYDFMLEYACAEGQFSLLAMDDEQQRWLPGRTNDIEDGYVSRRGLSVDVPAGSTFSLYISNHRPDGDGVSRFVLGRLTGSVPATDLLRPATNVAGTQPGSARPFKSLLAGPFRRLRARASTVVREQARERYEAPLVDNSARVRDLEDRVRALQPLEELAPLHRFLRMNRPAEVHQNASGDFQLLAREHWFELRGFAEFAMYSMNIDGLFESVAHAAGLQEIALEMPLCIYHLEHEKGSGWSPEGEALLKQRIADSGITWLEANTVHIWSAYMHWLRRPMVFNGSDWGFGGESLPETILGSVPD